MTAHRVRLLSAGVALVAVALLGGAGTAAAHSALVGSDPADGASLAAGPARVALTFSEPVQPGFTAVTVVGPDGSQWQAGPPAEDGAVVTVPVRPLGPAGEYTVGYRVLSADSHPVQGAVDFTLTAPGPAAVNTPTPAVPAPAAGVPDDQGRTPVGEPAATPAAPAADSADTPVWPWLVGAAVLLAAGVAVALRLGRSG